MDFQDIIYQRRSIRSYLDKPVSDETIMKILDYGHQAPSAGNLKPWEFIIVRDMDVREAIVRATYTGNDPNGPRQNWLMQPPVLIAICGNTTKIAGRYGDSNKDRIAYLDCSACIENMLLGAENLGLKSCYITGYHEDKMAEALKLPLDILPVAIIPLGYSDAEGVKRPMPELPDIIHYDKY